jgi:hypothetical protein
MRGYLAGVGAFLCGAALCGEAAAQPADAVLELHAVEGSGGKRVIAVTANGITFLDLQGQNFRAFKSARSVMKGSTPDWFILRDVDSNGSVDVVGVGKPSFVVSSDAEPIYQIAQGCDQFHLADFTADRASDILCRKGAGMEMFTYDGQKLWSYKIQGTTLELCSFGDVNGDSKSDIECKVKGKELYLRLTGSGEELGRAFDGHLLEGEGEDDNPGYADKVANYLKGEEVFDLNGDGTAEEWVKMDGGALVIGSRSKPAGLARHDTGPIFSVLVEDLNRDGKVELIAGGAGKVFFFDAEGKLKATAKADPRALKRSADARITGLNANGLEQDDEASVRPPLEKALSTLTGCYAGNVQRDPFAKVGRTIWSLSINDKGGVSKVDRLHSDLNDKNVEGCLVKALQKVSFPAGKDPGASVTVTLQFGFLDQ